MIFYPPKIISPSNILIIILIFSGKFHYQTFTPPRSKFPGDIYPPNDILPAVGTIPAYNFLCLGTAPYLHINTSLLLTWLKYGIKKILFENI